MIGKGKKQISMADVSVDLAAPYAAADAEGTLRLIPILQQDLERVKGRTLLNEIDMPLTPVLAAMEMTGALIDTKFFSAMSIELALRLAEIEKEIFSLAGKAFNINSPQQLSDVLFNHLRLEPPDKGRKTATGFYSTSADVLEALKDKHPILTWILEHRELSKLKSTYVDALPAAIDRNTGRVHTSYSQIGAVTGRLSSNNPNLQNIPIRTETGRRVRNGFIADTGNVLLSVDYSQIELRIVAHMAQDEAMLKAFRAGEDIHATTAAAIYDIDLSEVTKDMRRHAKAINFGLIYGMSAFGLAQQLGLDRSTAQAYIQSYFLRYPGVKQFMDEVKEQARERGWVETVFGRRLWLPDIRSSNQGRRGNAERAAINAPMQGTAADLVKLAMIAVQRWLDQAGLQTRLLMQVHDELILEVPQAELARVQAALPGLMTGVASLRVPLLVDVGVGPNWEQAH